MPQGTRTTTTSTLCKLHVARYSRAPGPGPLDRGVGLDSRVRVRYYRPILKKSKTKRDWYKTRRAVWFAAHGPCIQCGSKKQLEVDHINPRSKVSHHVWQWPEEKRAKELKKCQVLCKKCHIIKSNQERGYTLLTGPQVRSIRRLQKKGYGRNRIAKKFGISIWQARDILRGRSYRMFQYE